MNNNDLLDTAKLRAKELSIDEMRGAFGVLSNMYPDLSADEYEKIIQQRYDEGFKMVGVFDGGNIICCAGYWLGVRFYCGKFMQIDNMVTLPDYRGSKAGKILVDWVKKFAKQQGCDRILLDSFVENFAAHRFFLREGFIIRGYHLNYSL